MTILKRGLVGVGALLTTGVAAWLVIRPTVLETGAPPMTWSACQPGQVEVT